MRRRIALLALGLLWCGSAAAAGIRAESASVTFTGGGYVFDGEEKVYPAPVLGARLGYDMIEHMGLEASFNFAESKSKIDKVSSLNIYQYRMDALFYLMPRSWFVPYLSAGGGVVQTRGFQGLADSSAPVLDYGLGAKMFVADSVALRLEGRHFAIFDTDRRFNYEATFGINYYFGRGGTNSVPIVPQEITPAPAVKETVAAAPWPAEEENPAPAAPSSASAAAPASPIGAEEVAAPSVPASAPKPQVAPVPAPVPVPVTKPKPEPTAAGEREQMTSELKVRFASGSAVIEPRYHDELMKLADLLKFYPEATARLEAFGDGSGTKASAKLGMKRAESVKAYLVRHFGIAAKRLAPAAPSAGSTVGTVRVTIYLK